MNLENPKDLQHGAGYVHGYSTDEQNRLYDQARFLKKTVFETVDFSGQNHILEVGCGVGAQTENLLDRFAHLKVTGVDLSETQLERARRHLQKEVDRGQVFFEVANALALPYPEKTFDGAFLCWFLEHVDKPVEILRETRRVLKTGSPLYCREVFNASLFLHPYSPATLQYWFAFNDHQWNLKGDPFVGAKLGNYLVDAGYKDVVTEVKPFLYDQRFPALRAQLSEIWIRLLLSAAPALLAEGRVTQDLVKEMTNELNRLKTEPDAVFFYASIQGSAKA